MANEIANVLFDLGSPQRNRVATIGLSGLSLVVLAFNAAGRIHAGPIGLLVIVLLFLLFGIVGCYWYLASIHLLSQWLMTSAERRHMSSVKVFSTLQGLWPLLLLGPTVSLQRLWPRAGLLCTLLVLLCVGPTLIAAICRAYDTSWPQAALSVGLTLVGIGLALLGLVGWPLMLILGTSSV
jgi:hypothetical protein